MLRSRDDTLGLLLALAVILVGCAPPKPPNVLVILVDALRADHLGSYGYARETSPRIDALAAESLVFRSAHAQSPWTKPSIPTLFTSLYPIQHGVYEGEAHAASGALESDVLAGEHTTLAEVFHAHGYATVAFVHNAHLEARLGFSQGFDRYEQGDLDAPEINRRFLAFLDGRREGPFFAYLHYLDVHWPFQAEQPFLGRFPGLRPGSVFDRASWRGLRDAINDGVVALSEADAADLVSRHDAALAQLDHRIGELLDALRARGLLEHTLLLLTADHGEELLDHGKVGHGGTLFREVIEIPLLLRLPGAMRRGPVTEPARLIDVFPTLLAAAGIEAPPGLEGRDLLRSPREEPEIVAETRHKRTYRVSVRRGDWKYLRTYRAQQPGGSAQAGTGPGALAPGVRVKAKGVFDAQGALLAEKLSFKDSSDDDLELSGRVEFVRAEQAVFGVHGFEIDGDELLGDDGQRLVPRLGVGEWVKVEGKPGPGRSLQADKLERLAAGDHDDEIEGTVVRLEQEPDGGLKAVIGGVVVLVGENTRIKGEEAAAPAPVAPPFGGDDRFAPERLLSADAPPFEEQLFDLAGDPGERQDLSSGEPARAAALGEELARWLRRMAGHRGARAARQVLEPSSIEELRALGYLE